MGGAFWRIENAEGRNERARQQTDLSSSPLLLRVISRRKVERNQKLTDQLRSQPRFLQIQLFPSHNLPIPILYQLHRRSFQRPPTLTLPSIPTRLTLPITLLTLTLVRSLPSAAVLRVVVKLVLSVPARHARRRRGRVGEGPSLIVGGS